MEVRILGPLEVRADDPDGGPITIEARKERAVLAALATRPGRPVSADTLETAVWGESPPPTAANTLRSYISKLRRVIGADTIHSGAAGYSLVAEVDVERFEQRVAGGRDALAVGDVRSADTLLTEALELWRGVPLEDLADCDLRRGQVTRLEEVRWSAVEGRVQAELGLGHHAELVAEIASLVDQHPLRETLWASLMLALYRSGRQADALRRYRRLRGILRDELGVDPSPPLARLENQILRQDPALDLDPPPSPENLPVPITTLIGRGEEVRTVAELVHEHRLVTLLGPGGIGKTRLAVASANELLADFDDGVCWVDLAAVGDGTSTVPRILAALGVQPASAVPLRDALVTHLRHRELLLVLDNCEHVDAEAADLAGFLLERAPALRVLATSRLPLDLAGEHRYWVDPLDVPSPDAKPAEVRLSDAVRLFVERAEASTGGAVPVDDLRTIGTICTRLDGLPLAIELAAARSSMMSATDILARLEHGLGLLSSAATEGDRRHRSLQAVLEWSYSHLGDEERRLFHRLSVFPGSFDLAAVDSVGSDLGSPDEIVDAFGRLLEASMVVRRDEGEVPRFRLLETVSEYGRGRLADAELQEAHACHVRHYRSLALAAHEEMMAGREQPARERVQREDHNLRAAIRWSLAHESRPRTLELVPAVAATWYVTGSFAETVELGTAVLDGDPGGDPRLRGWTHHWTVWPSFLGGHPERAFSANHRALAYAQDSADPLLEAYTCSSEGHMIFLGTGDTEAAMPWYEKSLALCERHGLTNLKAEPLKNAAMALIGADRELDRARAMIEEGEELARESGDDYRLAHLLMDRWLLAVANSDFAGAVEAAERSRQASRRARSTIYEQMSMVGTGVARLGLGQLAEAEGALLSAARLALHEGNFLQLGPALQGLAAVAGLREGHVRAARLWGASLSLVGLFPMVSRSYDRYLRPSKEELGEQWDQECELGRTMSLEDAVDLALDSE